MVTDVQFDRGGKLTLRPTPAGNAGGSSVSVLISLIIDDVYACAASVDCEEGSDCKVVKDTGLPVGPENAMAGTPALIATIAAPLQTELDRQSCEDGGERKPTRFLSC